jgi:hypothetical protein
VVLAHYKSVFENPEKALGVVRQAIGEMRDGNFEYVYGLVQDEWFTNKLREENEEMLRVKCLT